MFKLSSSEELLQSFRALDRDQVELPLDFKFPMAVKDYLAWEQAAGGRVYLVVADPERRVPMGVVFRNDQGGAASATMCEWCHCVKGAGSVKLLTATASSKRRVGLNLCRDLSCKVERQPGPDDMPEIPKHEQRARVQRIIGRMTEFCRQALF